MSGMEPWMDLMAATVRPHRAAGPVVIFHAAQRAMPLLEQTGAVAWLHPQAPRWDDFSVQAHQHPALRVRLGWREQAVPAQSLWQRACLGLAAVPAHQGAALDALAVLLAPGPESAGELLLYGPASADGWSHPHLAERARLLQALPAPAGWRVLATAAVASALRAQGLTHEAGFDTALAQRLQAGVSRRVDVHLDVSAAPEWLSLRVRPPALSCMTALSEAMRHHIMVRDQALFGPRGAGSLLLPWDAPLVAKFLLRNVRARVDDMVAAMGERSFAPDHLNYTEQGAIVTFRLPAPAEGRDGLLHLSLPRAAVPPDDFCELGAVEFTAELA